MNKMLHQLNSDQGSLLVIDRIDPSLADNFRPSGDLDSMHYSHNRLQQMAMSQHLVNQLIPSQVVIQRDPHGKPSLEPRVANISISHTRGLMAVIINPTLDVAVDIEYTSRDVSKIWPRFTTQAERIMAERVTTALKDLFIWSCKECLFKVIPSNGVLFKEHFQLIQAAQRNGQISSVWQVSHPEHEQRYSINSFIFEPLIVSYIEHKVK